MKEVRQFLTGQLLTEQGYFVLLGTAFIVGVLIGFGFAL